MEEVERRHLLQALLGGSREIESAVNRRAVVPHGQRMVMDAVDHARSVEAVSGRGENVSLMAARTLPRGQSPYVMGQRSIRSLRGHFPGEGGQAQLLAELGPGALGQHATLLPETADLFLAEAIIDQQGGLAG